MIAIAVSFPGALFGLLRFLYRSIANDSSLSSPLSFVVSLCGTQAAIKEVLTDVMCEYRQKLKRGRKEFVHYSIKMGAIYIDKEKRSEVR